MTAICWIDIKSLARDKSAVAHVDYISRANKYDPARPGSHDRDKCLHVESINMPAWGIEGEGERAEQDYRSARRFWSACDRHERANARLGVKLTLAMPLTLSIEQQVELGRRFAARATTVAGGSGRLPASWSLHAGHERNPHAHFLLSERIADGHDRTAETFFRRVAPAGKPPGSGGARKSRELTQDWIARLRVEWSEMANEALEAAGRPERMDPRSNIDRGIDDVAAEKIGWGPGAEARRQRNARRKSINDHVSALRAEAAQIRNRQAAGLAQPETPENDHRPDLQQAAGRPRISVPDVDAIAAADQHEFAADRPAADAAPGHAGPAAARGDGLARARPDFAAGAVGARTAIESRADAAAGGAAAADKPSVLYVPGGRVDGRRGDLAGLVHGDPHHVLESGIADGHHGVRRPGAGAGNASWVAGVQPQASASAKLHFARPGRELIDAQRAIQDWAADFCERMEALRAALSAAKAAKAAAKLTGDTQALAKAPSLAKTPTLASLTATSLRPLAKLSARDLSEQLDIAGKGVAAMHDQWRQALNARDPQWIAACKAQHAARRARVESLQAETKRREAAPAPAPVAPQATATTKSEDMMTMTTDLLREQERITVAGAHETARLIASGGADGLAAAKRLPAVTARLKAIRKELAEREQAQASKMPEAPAPAPVETSPTTPAVPVRDPQGQREALRAAVEAAQRSQAERAAQHPAVQPTPEQGERARRADYDVPGRRRRT